MAVAVVSHAALRNQALMLDFPLHTKVKCESGLNGYHIWDKWIRENVFWVIETAFDPQAHVKITESAQLVGELKDPWELRCQKFLEGDETSNTFNAIYIENDTPIFTQVNRQAIQVAVSNAMFKYKVDFETDEAGAVVTHNALTVAIFNAAEDTSLSYTSDIEVAQLWTTRVLERFAGATILPILEQRAYADDPKIEESYPWIEIGELSEAEYKEWKAHNIKPEVTLDNIELGCDVRLIDETKRVIERAQPGLTESFAQSTEPSSVAEMLNRHRLDNARLHAALVVGADKNDRDFFNDWTESFTAVSTPANISTVLRDSVQSESHESTYRTVVVNYPEADSSSVSGDVSD